MSFIITLWQTYLFEPLLNVLIFIYNNFTNASLGLAVIYLTVLLRLALLPFSIISEKNKGIYESLKKKVGTIMEDRHTDPIRKREIIRQVLKENKVSHWAKGIMLGVQLLVLIVLYQVFLGGINFDKIESLYLWVYHPDYINTIFFGFDLGERSVYWSFTVAVILFLEIKSEQSGRKSLLQNSEVIYKYMFPLAAFLVLFYLPMVKSLFILTSLIFSFIVMLVASFARKSLFKK
ncbi:MAG: YidC/Oxa1 family membrane protein insertase [Patescibacteria group bacterium]|nr:YidC/Oxa1 family membrane protein insertase [Patescibacteria group bacterium]